MAVPCPHQRLSHGGQWASAGSSEIINARCAGCGGVLKTAEVVRTNDRMMRWIQASQRAASLGPEIPNLLRAMEEHAQIFWTAVSSPAPTPPVLTAVRDDGLWLLEQARGLGVDDRTFVEYLLIGDTLGTLKVLNVDASASLQYAQEAEQRRRTLDDMAAAFAIHLDAVKPPDATERESAPAAMEAQAVPVDQPGLLAWLRREETRVAEALGLARRQAKRRDAAAGQVKSSIAGRPAAPAPSGGPVVQTPRALVLSYLERIMGADGACA